jgi:NAD-dependent deacetylase
VTPAAWLPSLCPGKIVVVNKGEISRSYLPSSRVALHVEEDIDTFFTALAEKLGLSV